MLPPPELQPAQDRGGGRKEKNQESVIVQCRKRSRNAAGMVEANHMSAAFSRLLRRVMSSTAAITTRNIAVSVAVVR